jgi:hypothetical protein
LPFFLSLIDVDFREFADVDVNDIFLYVVYNELLQESVDKDYVRLLYRLIYFVPDIGQN